MKRQEPKKSGALGILKNTSTSNGGVSTSVCGGRKSIRITTENDMGEGSFPGVSLPGELSA